MVTFRYLRHWRGACIADGPSAECGTSLKEILACGCCPHRWAGLLPAAACRACQAPGRRATCPTLLVPWGHRRYRKCSTATIFTWCGDPEARRQDTFQDRQLLLSVRGTAGVSLMRFGNHSSNSSATTNSEPFSTSANSSKIIKSGWSTSLTSRARIGTILARPCRALWKALGADPSWGIGCFSVLAGRS